ncbi:DUF2125 domain-containing protein [Fretibacter rubidus]|uniref:DUF2125 domain-containing protein n=1 Tax=Fretibacter rubidus TaxID=570162 RepID=UPI00352A3A58
MKRFVIIFAVLLGGYVAYYFTLRAGLSKALLTAQSDLAEDGVTLSLPNIVHSGFPLSVRTTLTDAQISGPKGSVRAETATLSASPFSPTQWTLQSRGDMRVDWRADTDRRYLFDVSPSLVRADFGASVLGQLKSVRVTGFKLSTTPVIGTPPPLRAVDSVVFDIRADGGNMAYKLSAVNAFFDRDAARNIQRIFGPHIKALSVSGTLSDLSALDNEAVSEWQTLGAFTVDDSDLIWGDGQFKSTVNMAFAEGRPTGTMTLKVRDAQTLLDGLIAAGTIDNNAAFAAQLALMAAPRDEMGLVVLTLPITDGEVRLFGQKIYRF